MSNDRTNSGKVESPKASAGTTKPMDLNDVEMVFGTPNSPKTNVKPDVHLISNEKMSGVDSINNNTINGHGIDRDTIQPSHPLLEPDREHQKPPLADPEVDDFDGDKPAHAPPYPGIEDGSLEHGHKKFGEQDHGEGENKSDGDGVDHTTRDDGVGTEDGNLLWPAIDETDYPYDGMNGLDSRFGVDDRPGSPFPPGSIFDVNTYQQKKNLAQGMMDLALLSANANQLRYVLESSGNHPYFYPSIVFISLSIVLQVAVGVGLILNSRYNVKDDKDNCKADKINNMTVLGIFLITIINVFIASFSVASSTVASVTTTAAVDVQQAG